MADSLIDFNALRPNAAMEAYQQGQQNQLAQMQLAQQQQAIRDAEAERQAWKGATSYADVQQRLMGQGLGKQALAVGAAEAKQRADKIALLKGTTELMKSTATRIMANPAAAQQELIAFGQQTGTDVSRDLAQLQSFGNNTDAIKQWAAGHALEADKLLPKFQHFDTGGGIQTGTSDWTGKFTPGQLVNKTMAPGEAQRISLERDRVGLEGRRVKLAEEEAQLKRDGVEGISPKDLQKREAAYPQATSVIKGFESKSDNFVKDLKALRDHPGLKEITGILAGRVGTALTDEGRAALALYNKVSAKGGFQALQDLRDASKTGGALGNVSNQEGKQLAASFAAIDRTQNAKDVQAALDQAIGDVEGAKTRMREAYDTTYAYKAKKASSGGGDGVDTSNPLLK